jgi:hypothetical protein
VPLLLTKKRDWGELPVVMAAVVPDRANQGAAALDRRILDCAASLTGHLTGDLHVIDTYIPAALAAVVASGTLGTTRESAEGLHAENAFRYGQIAHLANTCGVRPGHLHVEMGTPEECLTDSVMKYRTNRGPALDHPRLPAEPRNYGEAIAFSRPMRSSAGG